jgi:membrane-associated phospholipid phosphatase
VTRTRQPRGRLPALAIAVTLALGCPRAEQKNAGSEPTGGQWHPVVLPSSASLRLPAPPERGGQQARHEQAELLELAKARSPEAVARARHWAVGASVRWNEIARDLVARHRVQPVLASRVYALLSVAQYDASVASWNNKYFYNRPAASVTTVAPLFLVAPDPGYPSEHAAIAMASAAVLTYLFPTEAARLAEQAAEHERSRLVAGVSFASDIAAGDELGRRVAELVVRRARDDGADGVSAIEIPAGEGRWSSAPDSAPVTPHWVHVRPWLMALASDLRAPPPPAYRSPAFQTALAEVKRVSDTRTDEQARTAALWADGLGSYTPAGRWNKIASDLIAQHGLGELRASRVLALLNMALMDAGIACWDSKYHYLLVRPSQADPAITTPVGLPNFPAYTSAHAAFSGAGAGVLAFLFPVEQAWLQGRAEEAAVSRIYGGIHYRFDGEAGLAQGRAVAELAKKRAEADGSP